MDGKTPRESVCEMTEVILPSDANPHGTVFGGRVVQWMDVCAAIAAGRHCRAAVVTASIDELHFHAGIRVGHVAVLQAKLVAAFRTSMEVQVRVFSEDPRSGERRLCTSALLTFVSIGPDGRPVPVARLVAETDEERARMSEATSRRAERLARRAAARARS